MLQSLARVCFRHRRLVLLGWVVALVGLSALSSAINADWLVNGQLPDTESTRALKTLEREFPESAGQGAGFGGNVVFRADDGISANRDAIDSYLKEVRELPRVTEVVSPFDGPNQISRDGKIAYARLTFDQDNDVPLLPAADRIVDAAAEIRKSMTVEFSGWPFAKFEMPASEALGLLAAVMILLLAFGSILAAGLPIVTALFGVGIGAAVVKLWSAVIGVPDFTTQLAAMIGIGVGIDYALFIVTRYRSALRRKSPEDAVIEALDTAGRAVFFAGVTVVISLLGMVVLGLDFIRGLAIGASSAVAVMIFAALTLVPAVLGFIGHNIDKLSLHRKHAVHEERETIWHRWSRFLQRHPWPAALGGAALLVVLALPLFSLNMGVSDDGNVPTKQTVRRAYDLLATGFGPGFNGPFLVTLEGGTDEARAAFPTVAEAMRNDPGVAFVSPPQPNASGTAAVVQVVPKTGPQEVATENLVHRLRADVVPDAVGSSGAVVHIGGLTPANADFATVLSDRLPWFFGAVLLLSFLLLLSVFRSVFVPLKAVVMNLLSIGAAYGVIIAVFQWGWGGSIIGIGGAGPIEPWAPMMLFAIVFGLSMDYEVFLLSKIREEYDRGYDNATAVVEGLAATARVITAAAAIMVFVFGSFILGDLRQIKLMGLGLSVAVFIDATIVRMLLVPATMELLGERNWWFPKWLDRIVPRLHVEPPEHPTLPEPVSVAGQ